MECGHTYHDQCVADYAHVKGVHFALVPCPVCKIGGPLVLDDSEAEANPSRIAAHQ